MNKISDKEVQLNEVRGILNEGAYEIRTLRHRLEIAEAKIDTMNTLRAFLFARTDGQVIGYGEDVAAKMQKIAEELK